MKKFLSMLMFAAVVSAFAIGCGDTKKKTTTTTTPEGDTKKTETETTTK